MAAARVDFRVIAVSDDSGLGALPRLLAAATSDHTAIHIREKQLSSREVFAMVCALRDSAPNARLLVNERADIAVAARADGVHCPAGGLTPTLIRKISHDLVIGASTHTLRDAQIVADDGADYVVFGPVYETPSKRRFGPPRGVDELRRVCASVAMPVFAIGGVTPDRARECREAGAHGIAAIAALLGQPDTAGAIREFNAVWGMP